MNFLPLINLTLGLGLAPLLPGIINKVKALFAGRKGQPLAQTYHDLWKLLHKGAVYSRTVTWVFRAGPVIGLACVLMAAAFVPFGGVPGLFSFRCDVILFAYLLGLMRFLTVLAALDTGSSFEGMGASREVQFSALAEPALLLGIAAVARLTHTVSLASMFPALSLDVWIHSGPALILIAAAFLIVFLTENARIPVDDPNTHLELTMIHEVMVLDHSGPDFAFILYGASLKLWVLGSLLVNLLMPFHPANPFLGLLIGWSLIFCLAVLTGVIESCMARLRLVRVPRLLIGATVLSGLALILILR